MTMTDEQKRAIELILEGSADEAARACDLDEESRGIYSDPDEILAYGVMPNSNEYGWYFAGYAPEIVEEHNLSHNITDDMA
jgi:hypothetical protein